MRAPQKSIQEELLQIQNAQLKLLEDYEKNAVGFSGKKIIYIKIKEDTQEKENDREFFGNIAKLFSK